MIAILLSACMIENGFHRHEAPNTFADEESNDYSVSIDSLIEDDEEESATQTNTLTTDPCAETETIVWNIEFPATQGCMWNENGNLSQAEAHFQARKEQLVSYDLDNGAEICDVQFEFSSDFGGINFPFHYDDHVLFTFNDRIVFSSYQPLNERFASDDRGYLFYDWDDMRGFPMQFYVSPFGVDNQIQMNLPNHDQVGDAFLSVGGIALSALTQEALKEKRLDLQFVSFGDNDQNDCEHSGFSFWVEIEIGAY